MPSSRNRASGAKQAPNEADSFLMGGEKVPSASFVRVGDSIEGIICEEPVIRQQTDAKTKVPMTWADGRPRNQLVVTLQTDENDPEIEDDDGRRRVYLKYKSQEAVREAIKEADAPGLRIGGWLFLEFVKQAKPTSSGLSGVKHYAAEYEPPEPGAGTDDFMENGDEEGDADTDEVDDDPPPRRAAKKAPAKAASRRRAPEPEPDETDDEPPARGRRRPAKAAPAKATSRRRHTEDDDSGEPF